MGHILKVCITILTLLLTVSAAAVIGVVVLVAQGPVSLGPLTPYLESALADTLAPRRVTIADTILSWDSEADRIDLRVLDVNLTDGDGRPILNVPQMSVTLSAAEVLKGQAMVTKVALIRPRLSLLRDVKGDWFLLEPDSGERWPLASRQGAHPGEGISFGQLRHLAMVDAVIAITDAASGASVTGRSVTSELSVEEDRLVGRATARLQFSDKEAAVGIGFEYSEDGQGFQAAVNIADLELAAVGQLLAKTPLRELARIEATVSGIVELQADGDGGEPEVRFDLASGPARAALPEIYADTLRLSRTAIKGRALIDSLAMEITQATLALTDGPTLEFAGAFGRKPEGFAVRGTLSATPFATALLRQYWPSQFAGDPRAWVMANIKAGTIANMKVALDLPAGFETQDTLPPDAVQLTWDFSGVTSTYLDDMPALQQGRGRGQVTAQRFDLVVDAAEVEGGLSVTEGRLAVADLNADDPLLEIDFITRGPASGVLALLDQPPLGLPAKIGLRPSSITGWSATATRLKVPLLDDITLDDVGYSAAATLTEIGLPDIWHGWDLHGGELTLEADDGGLRLRGEAQVNGIPVSLQWTRPIDSLQAPGKLGVRGRADIAQLKDLGFDPTAFGSGSVGMNLDLELAGAHIAGLVELELTDTALDVPAVAWSKAAGVPAGARFRLHLAESGGVKLDQLMASAPALEVSASMAFADTGELVSLVAPRLALNENRVSVDVRRAGKDSYDVDLKGDLLDLRPFDLDVEAGAKDDDRWPVAIRISADLKQVIVSETVSLAEVKGQGNRDGSGWQNADVTARIAADALGRMQLIATDYGHRLNFVSDNAGAAARMFGIYDQAKGGRVYLKARVETVGQEVPKVSGVLRADDFVLENAPLLAQVLTLGSLRGINDSIAGNGIAFTRLELPFTKVGDVIEVENGRAVGPALGLSGDLTIDNADDTIRALGTLVPAYSINSVLGNIPIIGNILVGRKGEGVFALTFQIEGPTADPLITVNPLSALAPGFLRRILEGLEQPTRVLEGDDNADYPGVNDRRR